MKNWRKEKTMWVQAQHMQDRYMYTSKKRAIAGLESLLAQMIDYAKDKFTVVMLVNGEVVAETKLKVVFVGDEWNPKFLVTKVQNAIDMVEYFEYLQKKGYQIVSKDCVINQNYKFQVVQSQKKVCLKVKENV